MKKVIRLTESNLVKLVKQVIFEQKFPTLRRLISNSADDLATKFGDDVISKLDLTLNKVLKSPLNTKTIAGVEYLMSASGSQVPVETLQKVLKAVSKGANVDELANLLPRQLADGSDLRTVIQNELSKKGGASMIASGLQKLSNFKPGTVVNSSSFTDNMINWANVSFAKNLDDYNKIIATALSTGNYQSISRGGFEKYGIPNFREFLMKGMDMDKRYMASPSTGQWYFIAK